MGVGNSFIELFLWNCLFRKTISIRKCFGKLSFLFFAIRILRTRSQLPIDQWIGNDGICVETHIPVANKKRQLNSKWPFKFNYFWEFFHRNCQLCFNFRDKVDLKRRTKQCSPRKYARLLKSTPIKHTFTYTC